MSAGSVEPQQLSVIAGPAEPLQLNVSAGSAEPLQLHVSAGPAEPLQLHVSAGPAVPLQLHVSAGPAELLQLNASAGPAGPLSHYELMEPTRMKATTVVTESVAVTESTELMLSATLNPALVELELDASAAVSQRVDMVTFTEEVLRLKLDLANERVAMANERAEMAIEREVMAVQREARLNVMTESTGTTGDKEKMRYKLQSANERAAMADQQAAIAEEREALAVKGAEPAERWSSMCESRMNSVAGDAERVLRYANEAARCLLSVRDAEQREMQELLRCLALCLKASQEALHRVVVRNERRMADKEHVVATEQSAGECPTTTAEGHTGTGRLKLVKSVRGSVVFRSVTNC